MQNSEPFLPQKQIHSVDAGTITWESPSNIALVKYWGKKEQQLPENTSLSFTLSQCKTITTLHFKKKKDTLNFNFEIYLSGKLQADFKPKIETFFKRIEVYMPFLRAYEFKIDTHNTFPHSSGIASSASGFSALALCLMSIENLMSPINATYFKEKASFLARLGSGSACRSIWGEAVVWGKHENIAQSNDLYGVTFPETLHENFKYFQDTILLVDTEEKEVSSTVGHNLMLNHPYAAQRFLQAQAHILDIKNILISGDLNGFVSLVEREALTLHAMMMTSMPYFILMKPNTLEIIKAIWKFRAQTGLHVCFTLDAGANVHVLYPKAETPQIIKFIASDLQKYCKNNQYICDEIGNGAKQII